MEKHKSTAHISVPKRKEPGNIVEVRYLDKETNVATDSLGQNETELEDTRKESNEKSLPYSLHKLFRLTLGQNTRAYAVFNEKGNAYALMVGSRKLDLKIRQYIQSQGERLKKSELTQINDDLQAEAELVGSVTNVFYRVAPVTDGIEIDVGDDLGTRIRITAGKVEVIRDE